MDWEGGLILTAVVLGCLCIVGCCACCAVYAYAGCDGGLLQNAPQSPRQRMAWAALVCARGHLGPRKG